MEIDANFIANMKKMYLKRKGTVISDAEAREACENLCGFFQKLT